MEDLNVAQVACTDSKTLTNDHINCITSPSDSKPCDKLRGGASPSSIIKLSNGTPTIRHPLAIDSRENSFNSDCCSLDCDPISTSSPIVEVRNNPSSLSNISQSRDDEDDISIFHTILSPDTQDVRLKKEMPVEQKRKLIPVPPSHLFRDPDDISFSSDDDFDDFSPSLVSPDKMLDSFAEELSVNHIVDLLPELTAEEETEESRYWQMCCVGGIEKRVDMKVIDPFKRVLSHGGYINSGSQNAIIVFSACFLPHRGRVDYNYVMENLFFYVLSTLDQLVMDDYVLVYLHGGATKDTLPKFSWLKRCYQMIDHRLRKNLRHLYIIHPTFWLKTVLIMSRPFLSSKFYNKVIYVESLSSLFDLLPLEQACIPDRVHQFDRIKQSIQSTRK